VRRPCGGGRPALRGSVRRRLAAPPADGLLDGLRQATCRAGYRRRCP
jgi:hypothetical protein